MHISKEDWLAQRAYALWESDGRREGRHEEHWHQAVHEYAQLEATRASMHGDDIILKFRKPARKLAPRLTKPLDGVNLPKAS